MKAKEKLVKTFAQSFNLHLKENAQILAQRPGSKNRTRSPKKTEILEDLSKSAQVFQDSIEAAKVSKINQPDFSGILDRIMCVFVTECRDISQPQKNKGIEQAKDSDDDEEEAGEDQSLVMPEAKLESRYLDRKFAIATKPAYKGHLIPVSRLNKFTCFDGVNSLQAMEYEQLDVKEFKTGMILTLRPPIEMRKGMMLLKKHNCTVVYMPIDNNKVELESQQRDKQGDI